MARTSSRMMDSYRPCPNVRPRYSQAQQQASRRRRNEDAAEAWHRGEHRLLYLNQSQRRYLHHRYPDVYPQWVPRSRVRASAKRSG